MCLEGAYDRANQEFVSTLYLITEKSVTLVETKYAAGASGTRGNQKKGDEGARVTQKALATTSIASWQDPDDYINEFKRLRNLLTEMEKPITGGHFTDIGLQGLTEEYRDVTLTTWRDPKFDLPTIQSALLIHTVYHLSRNGGSRGTRRDGLLNVARPCGQHQHRLIPASISATTAPWRDIAIAAASFLPRRTGKATSPSSRRRNLDQGAVLGISGALMCIELSQTTTPSATARGSALTG